MAELAIVAVEDVGDDRLRVRAELVRTVSEQQRNEVGQPLYDAETLEPLFEDVEVTHAFEAFGHVSATSNHFDESAYGPDGHRDDEKIPPRAMTAAEVGAYAHKLLLEQNPELASPAPSAEPVLFEAPEEAV